MPQHASKIVDPCEQEERIQAFNTCRDYSLTLCDSLSPEDHMIQGAPFDACWGTNRRLRYCAYLLLKELVRV